MGQRPVTLNAIQQVEMILHAALDPNIADAARKGKFVKAVRSFSIATHSDEFSDSHWLCYTDGCGISGSSLLRKALVCSENQ